MEKYYCDDPDDLYEQPRKRSLLGILTSIVLIAGGAFFVQTTLAANVTINSNQSKEFGQGIAQTPACSGNTSLTLTPVSTFVNASGGGGYYFNSATVSGIPDTCFGVDLIINAYGATSNSPLALFNSTSTNAVIYNSSGTFLVGAGSAGMSISSSTRSFTISFASPVALTSNIAKFTIQSGPHSPTCVIDAVCALGDIGPGGGTIYYVSQTAFTETGAPCASSCHYLEARVAVGPSAHWSINYATTQIGAAAQGTAIGTGYANTAAIISQNGAYNAVTNDYAAGAARSYTGGGKTDWFMPSKMELAELVTYESSLSVPDPTYGPTVFYNSSSEFDATHVWGELMYSTGSPVSGVGKTDNNHFISVRAL